MAREFSHCRAVEIPRPPSPYRITDHDDFADRLELNYEDIEPTNVIEYALHLVGLEPITPIDTTGMEFIPERNHGI